ncbi:zinc-binding alcohol dehydrogenase family protein [Dyella sp.]|uniref:quinone oxidoreductase family protein n=1 Tax=Dyella sp. TaxID=1869338 RepID=UPI002ED6866D
MKAALVVELGQPPAYGDFTAPRATAGHSIVHVTAASISHVTRGRASGSHYSAKGQIPFVPGMDGVGRTSDGQRVYFLQPEAPFGAMADQTLVQNDHLIALPSELDDITAAAIAIPGMSSWAALAERACLRSGETVLVHGATGASGRLAIQIARHLGASKVIATGRNAALFDDLHRLGADVVIDLRKQPDALEADFRQAFAQRVDVVLDYLWGPTAQTMIVAAAKAGPDGVPIRHVQIGALSGADINLPAAALRSSALQLMGSGIGSVPFRQLKHALSSVLHTATSSHLEIATQSFPLSDVTQAWTQPDDGARRVLCP